jgi:protein-S-isoprenylcysteine O-methyltransferase Ste14
LQPLPFSGSALYAIAFWATYGVWLILELVASRTKRSNDLSRKEDRGSLRVILILFWIGISLGFSLSYVIPKGAILWNRELVFFIGIFLMLAGIAFRRYAMAVLGRFFTFDVAIHSDQQVVDVGPYRYIRHPSYTGALVTQVGLGLALGNWASLSVIMICTGLAYIYRISIEEAALVRALGRPYQQYMRRTQRLIPFLFQIL